MELKYKAIAKFSQDEDPKVIAADLEVSYTKILRWRREYEEAVANNTINELLDNSEEALALVSSTLVTEMPEAEIVKGVTGLERLNSELQATAFALNNRIRLEAMKVEHMSELKDLTDCLCKIQDSFFNSKAVSVNVQNNYQAEGSPAYGEFLSDVPGALNG